MVRILALLVCLAAFCSAETKKYNLGPVELDVDADGIVVVYHGHEWIPDLSKLPTRTEDSKPVAWDELNEILYLSASRTLLAYDLRSEQISRIVDSFPGGQGTVSPSGRYVVVATSYLAIIDTQAHSQGSFHLPGGAANEVVQMTGVRWTGPSVLEYSAEIHGKQGVSRKVNGTLDVTTVP